jgi:hypothetical protein
MRWWSLDLSVVDQHESSSSVGFQSLLLLVKLPIFIFVVNFRLLLIRDDRVLHKLVYLRSLDNFSIHLSWLVVTGGGVVGYEASLLNSNIARSHSALTEAWPFHFSFIIEAKVFSCFVTVDFFNYLLRPYL